ncbi:hypothetical protein J6590_026597 [Homalodisca vitripennis]|nr:hypothetical protein J6590_026597 [Homalodisca vitripennis]
MLCKLVVAVTFLLVWTAAAELPAYRLPTDVIPHHYNLILSTDLDQFIFNGSVDIKIIVPGPEPAPPHLYEVGLGNMTGPSPISFPGPSKAEYSPGMNTLV